MTPPTNDPLAALPDDVQRAMLTAYRLAVFAQLDALAARLDEEDAREPANHLEPEEVVTSAA